MISHLPSPTTPPGMALQDRRVAFFGMGKSGLAGAEFLQAHGAQVLVVDERPKAELEEALARLEALGVRARAGLKTYEQLDDPDLIVISPGVPVDHKLLAQARRDGVPVIGEVELAFRFCAAPIVAVAGTNGKGSSTTMLGNMLSAAGLRCVVAGNIGTPLVSVVEGDWQVVVAEISSFQLETIVDFHPWAAILLNVTPDHLVRHGTFTEYVAAKQRLFMNQREGDLAVLNVDNEAVADLAGKLPVPPLTVSLTPPNAGLAPAAWLQGDELIVQLPDTTPSAVRRVGDLPLPGEHMIGNALCAAVVAVAAGCTPEQIQAGLRSWAPAAHQMSEVAVVGGVRFIDDSKATNVDSAMADVASVSGPVYVVAGGQTKGADMQPFADFLAGRARGVFLIGEGAFEIAAGIGGRIEVVMADEIETAVREAQRVASPGDTVILAPACASFDQFSGQAERGDRFAAAVKALPQ
ncbi:MAG: UDP-N-acetylmuramoyl-L-alanine--D-glutamate ligase [Armatimonadota bacterium]